MRNMPRVCPPCVLVLAIAGFDSRVPDGPQRDAVCQGGDGGPEVRYDDDGEYDVGGATRPFEGEDGEVKQADGHLGQGQGEDVEEQGEPPGLG